jgi:hypothetical protein
MSTIKQKTLAREIVKNAKRVKPLNATKLLERSGYTKVTARASSKKIMNVPGVQNELIVLGFDSESAQKVVLEIMSSKYTDASARLKATDQVFKVTGAYAPEKHLVGTKDFGDLDDLSTDELLKLREKNRK